MDQNNPPQNQELSIDLPEDIADGTYANMAIIGHSPVEFILDFVNIMPGLPKGKVKSRIILAPQHAKRLMKAMIENVQNYEKTFGVIDDNQQNNTVTFPLNFNGPKGQA